MGGISSVIEGLIALRYVERRSRSRRLLSIMKICGSGFELGLHEFVIKGGRGISIAGTFEGAEELLSGFARNRVAGHQPSNR